MHKTYMAIFLVILANWCLVGYSQQPPNETSFRGDPGDYRVLQYLGDGEGDKLVVVNFGSEIGAAAGDIYTTHRLARADNSSPKELNVRTGKVKLLEVAEGQSIGEVLESGTKLSKALFSEFWGVMAGDSMRRQNLEVIARQELAPTESATYFDVFEDPKAFPETFEISAKGKKILADLAKVYGPLHSSLLLIEGYTDNNGEENANQVESYQRALAVRQYLIDQLGFAEDRVVAVGFGEAEQVDYQRVPGYIKSNRRIVFKAISAPK